MKSKPAKSKLREWRDAIVFSIVVASLFRWSLASAFVIPTSSMENSLLVGDYLLVSKIHYGPRTPQTPLQIPLTHQKIWGTEIPSYLTWIQLPAYRLPGLRSVKRGETVVFNVPKDLLDSTVRPTDLKTYLIKRCVAIGGDVLEIRDKQVYVNGVAMKNLAGMKFSYQVKTKDELQKRTLINLGLDRDDYQFLGRNKEGNAVYQMVLTRQQVAAINEAPYVLSAEENIKQTTGTPIFPEAMMTDWTANHYGPLTIPKKGMTMLVSDSTLNLFGEIIEKYEGHHAVVAEQSKLTINGSDVKEYTFQQDYYFMMGDNRDQSLDSRYWGFVPEDHILGKPLLIWFSVDHNADLAHKIRWSRLFTSIE